MEELRFLFYRVGDGFTNTLIVNYG